MAMYDVTPEQMRNIASRIDTLAGEYQNLYNNNLFQSLVSGELAEAYKGTDAQALTERIKSYQVPFDAMTTQIKEYANFLRAAATSYENERDALAQEAIGIGRQ